MHCYLHFQIENSINSHPVNNKNFESKFNICVGGNTREECVQKVTNIIAEKVGRRDLTNYSIMVDSRMTYKIEDLTYQNYSSMYCNQNRIEIKKNSEWKESPAEQFLQGLTMSYNNDSIVINFDRETEWNNFATSLKQQLEKKLGMTSEDQLAFIFNGDKKRGLMDHGLATCCRDAYLENTTIQVLVISDTNSSKARMEQLQDEIISQQQEIKKLKSEVSRLTALIKPVENPRQNHFLTTEWETMVKSDRID